MNEKGRSVRVGQNVFDQPVPPVPVGVCQFVKKGSALGHLDFVMEVTLLFMAKGFTIRDKKLEVASVGRVDGGAEHFVDDAVADGEPKSATGVVSSTDTFLVGMRPARLDSWSSESCSAIGNVWGAHDDRNLMVPADSSIS